MDKIGSLNQDYFSTISASPAKKTSYTKQSNLNIYGYSLLELLVVLGIIGIVAFFTMPNFTQLSVNNEQQRLINSINKVIQYAKIQAIQRNQSLHLFPMEDNWSKGVVLKAINSANQQELIYQWRWAHKYWRIAWHGKHSGGDEVIVSNHPLNAVSNGEFIIDNQQTNQQVKIILNRVGRVKIQVSDSKI